MSRHRRGSIPKGAGQTVIVVRTVETDETGDPVGPQPDPHSIANCVFWRTSESDSTDRRKTSILTGTLGVPRGSDIKYADHVELENGTKWSVTSPPDWDQDHPMSRHNFGHMMVEVRSVT